MGEKIIRTHLMAFTTIKTALLLFAALCLTFGFCQEKDIVSEDAFQTSSETTRTSELDQAGYGWRRRRGDQARRERQGKQNLRNAERGNKERKKAAAERKSKNTAAERKSKNAAALKKEGTQKAQESKKEQKAKARRKLENQHKNAHQQFRAAAAKKAEKEAKKADMLRKWREIYKKSVAKAAAKLKRTFSEKVAKAKEKGSKKNVNVDKVARKCAKGRGKSEILGSMLLQWGFVKKSTDKVNVDKYVAKGQKAVEEGNTSRAGKIATKAVLNRAKKLLDCVNNRIFRL